MGQFGYLVYFTPIDNSESNTYGDEIDVSDKIIFSGIGTIRRSIDSSDYDVGIFNFSDLELVGINDDGYFNESQDSRSIFNTTRDRCKVRVVFQNRTTVRGTDGTVLSETISESSTYHGLINDEATRLDVVTQKIRFKVLSRDSVLRTTKISAGVVTADMLFSEAFAAILNVPRITSVLNFDVANINPPLDLEIDVPSYFNNKVVKEAIDKLLLVSNSVLLVNPDGDIIVRSRDPDETRSIVSLYGKYDLYRRENIIDITDYNSGRQRMFNSFVVGGRQINDDMSVTANGIRQKSFTVDFLTNSDKKDQIATALVGEFKTPKLELNVKVSTDIARDMQLLDRVSVNYPLRTQPVPGTFLPIVGITEIGDVDMPLPYTFGSVEIPARFGFKVIQIEDSPARFTSILKLRQIGTEVDDGVLDPPTNCILGFAVIGTSIICSGGDYCDTYNPSDVGAALVGCTEIA
jgi:hypothetical protein